MIMPPFTILILKNSRRPVTLRITMGVFLVIFGLIFFTAALSGFAASFFIFRDKDIFSVAELNNSTSTYAPVEPAESFVREKPDIQSLSVEYRKNNEMELKMGISSIPGNEEAYIWILVNPDADAAGEMVVYPRSPIFRGLPVDYRNGITYLPSQDNSFSITLSDEIAGIDIKQFRILVYSSDGKILADRYFREDEVTRT